MDGQNQNLLDRTMKKYYQQQVHMKLLIAFVVVLVLYGAWYMFYQWMWPASPFAGQGGLALLRHGNGMAFTDVSGVVLPDGTSCANAVDSAGEMSITDYLTGAASTAETMVGGQGSFKSREQLDKYLAAGLY